MKSLFLSTAVIFVCVNLGLGTTDNTAQLNTTLASVDNTAGSSTTISTAQLTTSTTETSVSNTAESNDLRLACSFGDKGDNDQDVLKKETQQGLPLKTCIKITTTDDTTKETVFQGGLPIELSDGCHRQGNMEIRYCNTDGCNSDGTSNTANSILTECKNLCSLSRESNATIKTAQLTTTETPVDNTAESNGPGLKCYVGNKNDTEEPDLKNETMQLPMQTCFEITTTLVKSCEDKLDNCTKWAELPSGGGYCGQFSQAMSKECRKSCNFCGRWCVDTLKNCPQLQDKCASNSTIREEGCPLTCGHCKKTVFRGGLPIKLNDGCHRQGNNIDNGDFSMGNMKIRYCNTDGCNSGDASNPCFSNCPRPTEAPSAGITAHSTSAALILSVLILPALTTHFF